MCSNLCIASSFATSKSIELKTQIIGQPITIRTYFMLRVRTRLQHKNTMADTQQRPQPKYRMSIAKLQPIVMQLRFCNSEQYHLCSWTNVRYDKFWRWTSRAVKGCKIFIYILIYKMQPIINLKPSYSKATIGFWDCISIFAKERYSKFEFANR